MYADQFYQDATGDLHFLSALDRANAASAGLPLPDASWTPITNEQADAIQHPQTSLSQSQAIQSEIVSVACACAITAGFMSSALGKARAYPSKDTDQRDLLNAALAAQGQPDTWTASLWCNNGKSWAFVPHTASQVQQVNADWLAYRQAQQSKYAGLLDQINAATTVDAVLAVAW